MAPSTPSMSSLVAPRFAQGIDDRTLYTLNFVTEALALIFVSIFVILRVYGKLVLRKEFNADDCDYLGLFLLRSEIRSCG